MKNIFFGNTWSIDCGVSNCSHYISLLAPPYYEAWTSGSSSLRIQHGRNRSRAPSPWSRLLRSSPVLQHESVKPIFTPFHGAKEYLITTATTDVRSTRWRQIINSTESQANCTQKLIRRRHRTGQHLGKQLKAVESSWKSRKAVERSRKVGIGSSIP